jgi:hypothetical protein
MNLNLRVGFYYAGGGVMLMCLAALAFPFGLIFLWPAASLILIAMGYFGLGAGVYGKRLGSHALWARILHCFTMLGQELSRRIYARQCNAWDALLPALLIGRQLRASEVEALRAEGVDAVVDLTAEFAEPKALTEFHYLNIPILDLTAPTDLQLQAALDFITRTMRTGKVYLHCKIGYSRTATIAACFLIQVGRAQSPEEAMALLRKVRPSIVIRPEAEATIRRFSPLCHPS